jgi:hypothetical protein
MGTATTSLTCGCVKTRLLEPDEDIWITWTVCALHYEPERDDPVIRQAAENRRRWLAALEDQR